MRRVPEIYVHGGTLFIAHDCNFIAAFSSCNNKNKLALVAMVIELRKISFFWDNRGRRGEKNWFDNIYYKRHYLKNKVLTYEMISLYL